ncbi:MAG: hypothetical protein GVY32_02010 [Gammaproteobacteria bacterium]|nr:hypothetical protein [Gammaproteobacteria bacterium]
MNIDVQYHRIVLVRACPGSAGSRLALERIERWLGASGTRLLAFFHGAGVDHAATDEPAAEWRRLSGWHDVGLEVCSGSWQRRHASSLSPPWQLSSLVAFWHRALAADEVICFGRWHER